MDNYKFPMEKILNLRSNQEKYMLAKFAEMQKHYNEKVIILKDLVNKRQDLNGYKCGNINQMNLNNLYRENLANQINIQNNEVKEAGYELEKARRNLATAQRDRKIMDKLKEKDFISYQDKLKKEEQNQLDEMAIQRYNRTQW